MVSKSEVLTAIYSKEIKTLDQLDKSEALSIIVSNIAEICLFFNVQANMNPQQIQATSEMILSRYNKTKATEIKIWARRCMFGDFGKSFARLDGPTLLEWFGKYEAEKSEELERFQRAKKDEAAKEAEVNLKEVDKINPESRVWIDKINSMLEPMAKKKEVKPYTIQSNGRELFNQKQMQRFEQLFQRQISKGVLPSSMNFGAIKFVRKYGRMVSLDEYCELRLKVRRKLQLRTENPNVYREQIRAEKKMEVYYAKVKGGVK